MTDEFNISELMAKVEERTPYIVVAFQECERMNILTREIQRSLSELDLGLKVGEVLGGGGLPKDTAGPLGDRGTLRDLRAGEQLSYSNLNDQEAVPPRNRSLAGCRGLRYMALKPGAVLK